MEEIQETSNPKIWECI